MKRRELLLNGSVWGIYVLSIPGALADARARNSTPLIFAGESLTVRLSAYVAEYVSRYYSGCDGIFPKTMELSAVLEMPKIDMTGSDGGDFSERTGRRRLSTEFAADGYMQFERHVQDLGADDFSSENVVVLDGWILPMIEAELLIYGNSNPL